MKVAIDYLPATDELLTVMKQNLAYHIRVHGGWMEWKEDSRFYREVGCQKLEYMEFIADTLGRFPDGEHPMDIGQACDYHVHIKTPKCQSP